MTFEEYNGEVFLQPEDDFAVKKIFDCGQCFRWVEQGDGSFKGIAYGKSVSVRLCDDILYIENLLK